MAPSPQTIHPNDAAYARAIFFLKFRSRSRMEIANYLRKNNFSDTAIASAIDRLEAQKYINDPEFARMWIDHRLRFRPRGKYALTAELRQKGIDEPIIKEALKDFDEYSAAWSAAAPRLKKLNTLEKKYFYQKLYAFLNRRGFEFSVCRAICDQAWEKR